MNTSAIIITMGLVVVLACVVCVAFVLLRFPDFRREFFDYYGSAIAARLRAWTGRTRR